MYLNFYQLSKKPFSLAPDPDFLYLSQQHKDALGAIIYGVREREGFVSVVGEVGTGKTTIIRSYLNSIHRKQILPIFIFNSKITFSELMQTFMNEIGFDFEVIGQRHAVNEMVRLAYHAMLEKASQGKSIVLIIDEAQNMPIETLGNLCILSNFETSKDKLIQIVLVGQPELQKKLDLYQLRQLRQRVAYRAKITPLSTKEGVDYIHHRLSLSSKVQKPVFTKMAVRRIVKHSKGVPRVINILCENSLVASYGLQKKPVSLKLVKQVIAEYEGKSFSGHFPLKKVVVSTLILLLTSVLVASFISFFPRSLEGWMGQQFASVPLPDVSRKPTTTSAEEEKSLQPKSEPISPLFAGRHMTTRQSANSKIVKRGDTVSKLFFDTYGFYSTQGLEWLKSQNPHIDNMDDIQIDQIIYFPEIDPEYLVRMQPGANSLRVQSERRLSQYD